MRRLFLILVTTATCIVLYAQEYAPLKYDTQAELEADIWKSGGELYVTDFPVPSSDAPKGYRPFYISMFNRHGARFAHNENIYGTLRKVLSDAHEAGQLTETGERLYRQYNSFYPKVAFREGGLTQKGQAQWRRIADQVYSAFPEVFKGKTSAVAVSTNVQRVLLSMFSFLDEISELDKSFEFTMDAGNNLLSYLQPDNASAPGYVKGKPRPKEAADSYKAFFDSTIDPDEFASRFFINADWIESRFGKWKFQESLINIIMDTQCIDDIGDPFAGLYSNDDFIKVFDVRNYGGYLWAGRSPLTDNKSSLASGASLKEIIESADKDMDSGLSMRLRFSHDSGLLPLLCFMRLDSFGAVIDKAEDVRNIWRSFDISMASNLMMVFYRNKKSGDILVRPIYNGHDAILPLPSKTGSFYSWNEFKEYYLPKIEDAEQYINSLR